MTVTPALPSTARPGDTLAAGPGDPLAVDLGDPLAAGQTVQNLGVMAGPLEPWRLS